MHQTSGSTRVKICGLTNLADAAAAATAGADYLGFVFIERSARFVKPVELTPWWNQLPSGAKRVALFQDPSSAEVETVLNQLEIDVVQFHGHESPEFCCQFGLPYWKSVGLPVGGSALGEPFTRASIAYATADALLIDSVTADARGRKISGGTGKQFDWALWPRWYQEFHPERLILAGGLGVDNVSAAVEALQPAVVDVSSGVEASPGKKDPKRLTDFCAAARNTPTKNDRKQK